MLSINNKSEQLKKNTARPNRFALRKLSVGLCSVLVGLTFMGLSAHADQVTPTNNLTTTVTTVQESSAAKLSKQAATNLSTDTAASSSQASASNASAAPSQSTAASQASSTTSQDSSAASSVASSAASSATPANSAASSAKPSSLAAQNSEVNVNDWTYTRQSDGIVLNGFNGHIVNSKIVVPNSYDFIQAGIISAGQKVYLGAYFRNNTGSTNNIHRVYGSQASEFMISKDGNGKVYATGNWGDAFNGTPYKIIDLTNLDVSGVTRMSQMFAWSMAEQIIGLDGWDTSNVTDMGSMFLNDQHLQSVGDLSHWNVSNVTNMVSMFELASSLRTPGDLSSWNVSKVQNMGHMFAYATSLTSLGDLSNWKLSNVERTDMMFMQNWNLQNIGDLSGWDMSKDQDMSHMFDGAASLVNLGNLGQWHTGNVTNMEAMFLNAKSLQSIGDLSTWDTAKVISMSHMFDTASSLTNLGDLSNWNTANVTDMQYLFNDDQKLQHVGLLNHWQTGKVTNMDHMFYNNYSLDKLDLSNWDTSKVTFMVYTFACEQLNQSLSSLGDLSNWDVSNVTSFFGTFSHLANITTLGDLSNWKTGNAQNMQVMFYEMRKLQSLDVSNWDTSKVTNMVMMLMNDYELGSLTGLANWNVSNVTAANAMFCRTGLSNIDIHGWNLGKDRDTRWMFAYSLKPVVIDMRGVTLPTSTSFSLLSFYGNQPIVVYSDQNSKLFSLNTAKLNGYYDWVGNTTINVTGRQNTNHLTLHKNDPNAANGIAPMDLDDDTIATLPMNFVFTDHDDLVKQMQENTKKSDVNKLVADKYGQNVHVNDDQFDNKSQSLRHNFNQNPTKLVTDSYALDLAGDAYSQQIIYKDQNGKVIKNASINGFLDGNGQATISKEALINAINANLPANYQLLSDLPNADFTINSAKPTAIIVTVKAKDSTLVTPDNPVDPVADVIYETVDGHIVGRTTINGNVGQTINLNLQLPDGYESINPLPTTYTFTDAENQQLIIYVKVKTPDKPVNPVNPDKPVTPDKPVVPDKPVNPVTPVTPDQPVTPDKPAKPEKPATPSTPAQPAQNIAVLTPAKQAATASQAPASTPAARLPQTGVRQHGDLSLIGLSLMSISGIIALCLGRKREF